MKRIYLDYAATTTVDKTVKKAMEPYFDERFGNPNSLHYFGQQARGAIDMARQKTAEFIGAGFDEIIFTGSATEANNLALRGLLKHSKIEVPNIKPKIIISAIEHDSILETVKDFERDGVEVVILPINKNGIVDLKKLEKSLDESTILVSIIYANNEIGSIQNIERISKIISNFRNEQEKVKSDNGFPVFHIDAVQAFQFLNCNVNDLGVDMMTLSAHKIYGPKGVGVLYIKSGKGIGKSENNNKNFRHFSHHLLLSSLITGGGQEFGLRSGTENVAGIVGMAKAVELVDKNREKEAKRMGELKKYFISGLKKIYPKIVINGSEKNSLPNIVNIYFPGEKSEDLLIKLDMAGIAVSSGSACASFSAKPSHVLEALGYPEKRIKGSLRFSFGKFTDKNELKSTLKILKSVL